MRVFKRENCEQSQKKPYAGDWVFECVLPGKEDDWDIGVNYTECGIVKLYQKYANECYLPYVCLGDYPMMHEMGLSLKCTQTLGHGAPLCEFRICMKKDDTCIINEPENLPEFIKR